MTDICREFGVEFDAEAAALEMLPPRPAAAYTQQQQAVSEPEAAGAVRTEAWCRRQGKEITSCDGGGWRAAAPWAPGWWAGAAQSCPPPPPLSKHQPALSAALPPSWDSLHPPKPAGQLAAATVADAPQWHAQAPRVRRTLHGHPPLLRPAAAPQRGLACRRAGAAPATRSE